MARLFNNDKNSSGFCNLKLLLEKDIKKPCVLKNSMKRITPTFYGRYWCTSVNGRSKRFSSDDRPEMPTSNESSERFMD